MIARIAARHPLDSSQIERLPGQSFVTAADSPQP
jgi:hypothetical protein